VIVKLLLIKTNESSLECMIVELNRSFPHTSQPSITRLRYYREIFPPKPHSAALGYGSPDSWCLFSVMGVFCQQNTRVYPNVNEPIKDRQDVIGPDTLTDWQQDRPKIQGKVCSLAQSQ